MRLLPAFFSTVTMRSMPQPTVFGDSALGSPITDRSISSSTMAIPNRDIAGAFTLRRRGASRPTTDCSIITRRRSISARRRRSIKSNCIWMAFLFRPPSFTRTASLRITVCERIGVFRFWWALAVRNRARRMRSPDASTKFA